MKKILYFLALYLLVISCEKYPEMTYDTNLFNFTLLGNNQSAEAGNILPEEVGIQFNSGSSTLNQEFKFKVVMEVIEGGGSVDQSVIYPNENGVILTHWKIGDTSNKQTMQALIYDMEDRLLSKVELKATAYFPDQVNTITDGYFVGIIDFVSDTINQRSMMYSQNQIWVSTNEFYSWKPKGFPYNTHIRLMDMTTDGTVFAAGWNGALYKTEDWGDNWQYICNPFPESNSFYNLKVTSDDFLWATKTSYGVCCSKDNGLTWTYDTTEVARTGTLGPMYKYGNSYTSMSSNPMSIIITSDGGITWKTFNTPETSLSMFVPNDTTIIAQNQGGFKLHKSTDNGKNYKLVLEANASMGGGNLWHVYNKFENDYYVLAPSSGVWKTKDFEEFELVLKVSSYQQKLFIDHKGNIYVVGDKFINAEDESTFIIPRH